MDTPRVWFPAIRAGSGADVFTQRLADGLNRQGVRAEITWLPHRAEYAPWTVPIPKPPRWANVVHVNTWLHNRFIPRNLPVMATVHHIVHDPALLPYKSPAQRLYHAAWIRRIEAAVLERAQVVTAVSAFTAGQVRRVFGLQNVQVIHNWVDTDRFRPGPERAQHSPFRLLFVGNWNRRKGADLLPLIMQKLGPAFDLWTTAGLRGRRVKEHLPANIHFLGRVGSTEELVQLYQDCDALLFPSRLEGFGLVALEAQACGLPVIATNGSSIPEVVKDGVTGILCSLDDIGCFVTAIERVARDAQLRAQLQCGARKYVIDKFSHDSTVPQYIECYRGALSGHVIREIAKKPNANC